MGSWAAVAGDVDSLPAHLRRFVSPPRGPNRPLPRLDLRKIREAGCAPGEVSAEFRAWLSAVVSLYSLGNPRTVEQFQRLAVSLAAHDDSGRLGALERVDFSGSTVAGRGLGELDRELERALTLVSEIATSGWEIGGARARRLLVLHPDGVVLQAGGGGEVVLHPELGLVLRGDGRFTSVARMRDESAVDAGGCQIDVSGEQLRLLKRIGEDFEVRAIPPEDVFADAVNTLRAALHLADDSRGELLLFQADPVTLGVEQGSVGADVRGLPG
jgi:hypothetical protein